MSKWKSFDYDLIFLHYHRVKQSFYSLHILNSVYFIANLAGKGKIPENQAWIKKKKNIQNLLKIWKNMWRESPFEFYVWYI